MPKGRLMVLPADVRVIIHDAISTEALTRDDARPLAARVEDVIRSAMGTGRP
jgi:hypothetical protein